MPKLTNPCTNGVKSKELIAEYSKQYSPIFSSSVQADTSTDARFLQEANTWFDSSLRPDGSFTLVKLLQLWKALGPK